MAAAMTWQPLLVRAGADGPGDPRVLGLALGVLAVAVALAAPAQNLVSRQIEARADRHALDLTGDPTSYAELQRDLAVANKRVEAELSQSRNEAATRLADAERRAQAVIEEAKARATEEAGKIVAAARQEAEQQVVKAREALREEVAALAVKGAEQILKREVNAGVHAELLGRLKTEL